MIVQGSFTISVPNNSFPIKLIKFDNLGSCLDIDLRDVEFPDGATGANANIKAQNLSDLLNFATTNPSVVILRNNNNLNATVNNNIVTVNLLIDDTCCDSEGFLRELGDEEPVHGGDGSPFIGAVSNMQCSPLDEPSPADCGNYPPNVHIFRFQFVPQPGFVFGVLGTDYRYTVEPFAIIIPTCNKAISIAQFQSGLSSAYYTNPLDFYNGWAATINAFWVLNYNGSCTHLGNGRMEMITDIATWNLRFADICPLGLGVQCNYVDTQVTPNFDIIDIEQYCCIPDPPQPPVPPVINPPRNVNEIIVSDESCEFYTLFDCCNYGIGGVKRLIFQDRANFKGVCLDLFGIINSITTTSPIWYEPCLNKATSLSITLQNDEKGLKFNHEVKCGINVMTHLNRLGMMELLYKKLIVIVVDNNNRAWLLGEDYPVKIRNMSSETGGESSNHFFDFINESRRHARGIKKEVIDSLIINQPVDCGDYVGLPLGTYTLNELKDCYLFDMQFNFLN